MSRRINQVALVVSDQKRSTEFYADVFGMDHIFGTAEFRGPDVDQVHGMKNAASSTQWLIDDREMFQLEIFQFENPQSRPLPTDHDLTDEGYNRVIIAVKSLQRTGLDAVNAGATMISPQSGDAPDSPDQSTHGLLRDPDGILLELIENPELVPEDRAARIIGLGITSRDLATTVEDMRDGFGFKPCEDLFQHKDLFQHNNWQQNGRLECTQTLRMDDMYLVVSQYRDSRPRRLDHRLGDIGIMNFALGFPNAKDFDACFSKTRQMGMRSNIEPMIIKGMASVTYNNDRQGFSVEMLFLNKKLWGMYGFVRPGWLDRLLNKVLNWRADWIYRKHLAGI
jgi:catechol 2,3-dioxygenase-like lactoylglutathione lyase family enzyme